MIEDARSTSHSAGESKSTSHSTHVQVRFVTQNAAAGSSLILHADAALPRATAKPTPRPQKSKNMFKLFKFKFKFQIQVQDMELLGWLNAGSLISQNAAAAAGLPLIDDGEEEEEYEVEDEDEEAVGNFVCKSASHFEQKR